MSAEDEAMQEFLNEKLHIVHDGILHVNEVIAIALVVVALILLIVVLKDLIRTGKNKVQRRKKTIFSHRKNRYKDRIGKKNKF